MELYEVIDLSIIPVGALFVSINQNNEVNAHYGETWKIGNDIYSTSSSTYLGESFTPVKESVIIEIPITLEQITDEPRPYWADYITISGSGWVTYWEFEPSKEVNGDDFDDYFYDFDVKCEEVGKTLLKYYYQKCYNIDILV